MRHAGPVSQGAFSQLPVRRVQRREPDPGNPSAWPRTLPVARQLLAEGLDLGPITVLVGENWGYRRTTWEDLDLVGHWRRFLADPQRYLRHVLAP